MDEQTDAEPTYAALRDVIDARPMEAARRPLEAEVDAEPLARLQPMEAGVAAEPLARLQPVEAEPLARLQPMQAGVAAEPTVRPESTEVDAMPAAPVSTARLRPVEMDAMPAAARETAIRPEGVESAVDGEPALTRSTTLAAAGSAVAPTAPDALRAKRLAPTTGAAAQTGGGASAGSGFQVDPDQYQAAISPVLAAADQLSQLVTGLSAFLDHTQSTAPWGNDESGKKFAEGEKGYLKYSGDTLKGLKGMPDAVRYVADGLKAMAENYRAAEDGTASSFQDDGGSDAVSVPQTGTFSAPVDVMPPTAALRGVAQARPSTNRRA